MSEAELKESHATAAADTTPAASGRSIAYKRCGPGESISDPRPGDIVLIRGTGWLGKSIRFFIRMRCRRDGDRALAHWSHAGIIVSSRGHLIEVVPKGVVLNLLENYQAQEYHYVYLDLSPADRIKASQYAYSCVKQKYGRLSF